MDTIVKKVNDFFHSYKAITILCSIGTVVGILELIAFFFLGMEINGVSVEQAGENIVLLLFTVFIVALALGNLFLGFLLGVLNARGSRHAANLSMAYIFMNILLNMFAGLWLVTLELLIVLPLTFYRGKFWAAEKYKNDKYTFKNYWWLVLLTAILSAILFFGLVGFFGHEIYSFTILPGQENGSNADRAYVWYLDAVVATLGVMGNVCFIFRWRLAYVWWTMSKLPIMICFAANGNIVQIFQMMIWIVVDMGTVLAMTYQLRERKELLNNHLTLKEIEELDKQQHNEEIVLPDE